MWHELAAAITENAPSAPSTNAGSSIVIALIGVGGSALAGLFVLLNTLAGRKKDTPAPPVIPSPPPPVPMNSDKEDEHMDALRALVDRYEQCMWLNHINPTKILTGTEKFSEIGFD